MSNPSRAGRKPAHRLFLAAILAVLPAAPAFAQDAQKLFEFLDTSGDELSAADTARTLLALDGTVRQPGIRSSPWQSPHAASSHARQRPHPAHAFPRNSSALGCAIPRLPQATARGRQKHREPRCS